MVLVQSNSWFWVVLCICYTIQHNTNEHEGGATTQHKRGRGLEKTRILVFFVLFVLLYDGLSRGARALFVFVLRCKTYFFYFLYVFCFVLFCFFLFFLCFFVFFGVFWWFFDTFFDFCFTGFELVFLMFFGAFLILFLILAWFIPFFDYNRITIRRAKTFCDVTTCFMVKSALSRNNAIKRKSQLSKQPLEWLR
jgi:hypothetical protein